jgi:hypothetical protein
VPPGWRPDRGARHSGEVVLICWPVGAIPDVLSRAQVLPRELRTTGRLPRRVESARGQS